MVLDAEEEEGDGQGEGEGEREGTGVGMLATETSRQCLAFSLSCLRSAPTRKSEIGREGG